MPSTIGPNEIARLRDLVNAGDRIAYYTQLAAWGDDYGRLALGVVNNDTLSGATANIYFVQHAGPNGSASAVPFDTLANISLDLMRADFDRREAAFNAGQNALDLPVDTIHTYHTQVFADYQVEPIAWTPHFALDQLATVEDREALWDELLQAGGLTGNVNAYVQSLTNAALLSVGFATYSFDLTAAGALATTAPSTDYGPYSVSLGANLGSVIGGNASSNTLTGTSFGDVLMGFDGADEIIAGDGSDRLYGGEGADILSAGFGSDRIDGGAGDDILNAGNVQISGAVVNTGLLNLSWFPGGWFIERSWDPADQGTDYLAGGIGNDIYWVGAHAGLRLNLGPGGSLRGINADRSASILDIGASGNYILNNGVFENIDVIFDSDGQGVINWGLDGAITPLPGPLISLAENCSGTFNSGTLVNLTRSERFSDLLSAIFGEQMNVYHVPRTTGQLGQYPLLATITKVTDAEGVTFDRLLFFTDPTRDGIDYIYNSATNAIQFLGHLYGVFAIDGYYAGIPTTGSGALSNALMAAGTTGAFGINITGYVGSYTGNDANNNITSTIGADTVSGGGGDDAIFALDGNDFLYGGAGLDTLNGGLGADHLWGGLGADVHIGGDGAGEIDYARYDDANYGKLTIRLDGLANAGPAAVGDTYVGIEGVVGGIGNEVIVGNNLGNFLRGGGGADSLDGRHGNDHLTGGGGADRFRFTTALNANTNVDIITDFVHGTDELRLKQSIFASIGNIVSADEFYVGTSAADANDFIIYNGVTGRIYYDANGDTAGGQTLFARVDLGTVLDFNDFAII